MDDQERRLRLLRQQISKLADDAHTDQNITACDLHAAWGALFEILAEEQKELRIGLKEMHRALRKEENSEVRELLEKLDKFRTYTPPVSRRRHMNARTRRNRES